MNGSIVWRAAGLQVAAVAALSLLLAVTLPHSFFEDWGWLAGPGAWLLCAAVTASVLKLDRESVLLGAILAGIPSAIAVVAGVHWLGVAIAVVLFGAWCGWLPHKPGGAQWT
jgi:hypothetical protein